MVLFKVVLHGNPSRKAVNANTLAEVMQQCLKKFNITEGQHQILLEEDGTEIDDDEILLEFANASSSPISLLLLPEGQSYSPNQLQNASQTETTSPTSATVTPTISTVQTNPGCSYADVSNDQNLWSTFSTSLTETVTKKERASHTQRLDLVKNLCNYMMDTLRNTTRGAAVKVCQAICDKYPDSFLDKVDDDVIGKGYESLLGQLTAAISFRKSRGKKRSAALQNSEVDDDGGDSDGGERRPQRTQRKEDEYGCVEYNPLLPEDETPSTQDQKREDLVQLFTSRRGSITEDVIQLMAKTYPTQRNAIIQCSIGSGLTTKFFTRWPYLKKSEILFQHATILLGKDVVQIWSSKLTAKVPLIRSLMKLMYSEKAMQAKKKGIAVADTFVRDTLKESKKQARQVVRGELPLVVAVFPLLVDYFNEDPDHLFIIVKDTWSDLQIIENMPHAGPTLLIEGSSIYDETATYSVILEKKFKIKVTTILEGFLLTLLSYYIFGCLYPNKLACTLEFMQRVFLALNPKGGKKSDSKKRKKSPCSPKVFKLINMLE